MALERERILIVDDNPLNLKLARLVLAGEGFEIRTAADAPEALESLKNFHPALILMDVLLPGMDGLELTRRIKAMPSMQDVVIIALTACAMRADEQRARAAGCDGHIAKPIDTRTFSALVRRFLEEREAACAQAHHSAG